MSNDHVNPLIASILDVAIKRPVPKEHAMTALAQAIFLEAEFQRFRLAGGYGVEREIGRWLRANFARKS